jgi:hypothetical protein
MTAGADSDRESEKVIVDLGKKYGLTTEMFVLDDSIFKLLCPNPPADIQGAHHYTNKSTEKDALVMELYGCIDYVSCISFALECKECVRHTTMHCGV